MRHDDAMRDQIRIRISYDESVSWVGLRLARAVRPWPG